MAGLVRSSLRLNSLLKGTNVINKSLITGLVKVRNNSTTKVDGITVHPVNRWEGSWHWYIERALSVSLIPMLGVSFLYGGHPINDFLLGFVVPIHTHIGLSSVVTDYLPGRKFPIINKVAVALQAALTLTTMYGCYIINTEDVGVTEYLKKVWKSLGSSKE